MTMSQSKPRRCAVFDPGIELSGGRLKDYLLMCGPAPKSALFSVSWSGLSFVRSPSSQVACHLRCGDTIISRLTLNCGLNCLTDLWKWVWVTESMQVARRLFTDLWAGRQSRSAVWNCRL